MPKTKLKVEIDADSAKFNRRMKALGATVAGIGIAIAAVGVVAAVAFVRMAADVAKMNDELGKSAKKLQLTIDQLQQLQLLAQFSGVGLKGVEGAFRGIGVKVLDLKRGLAAAKEEFALIGLDESAFGGNTFDNFVTVLKSLEKIEDKQLKLAIGNKLLGRSGADFIAALSEGAGSMDKIMDRVRSNRDFFVSDKEVDKAEQMNDQIAEFQLGLKKVKSAIASEVFPAFEELVKSATEFIRLMLRNEEFPALLASVKDAAEELGKAIKGMFSDIEMDDFIKQLTEIFKLISGIAKILNDTGIIKIISKTQGASLEGSSALLEQGNLLAQGASIMAKEASLKNVMPNLEKLVESIDKKFENLIN